MNVIIEVLVLLASLEYLAVSGWKFWLVLILYGIAKTIGWLVYGFFQGMMKKLIDEVMKEQQKIREDCKSEVEKYCEDKIA